MIEFKRILYPVDLSAHSREVAPSVAAILSGVKQPDRLGVCFDTCHVFAAGYSMATRAEYQATMRQFDDLVGGVDALRGDGIPRSRELANDESRVILRVVDEQQP